MRPRTRNPLRMPGHDSKVSTDFFFADEPTVVLHERLDGPPPSRKNPEYPLLRRIRMKAESWRKLSVWRRYVPEVLPLEPSQQGSPNVLMVLRLIEESPVSPHFPVHSGVPKERGCPASPATIYAARQ